MHALYTFCKSEIRPNVVPKNKKPLKSIKIPRVPEVSSGFEPLYKLLQSSA
jgi:hypothetical protein